MNGKLNIKEWRNLERQWEKALKEGKEVIVDIKVNYVGDSLRPDSFDIVYQIGDEKTVFPPLMNVKGGK